MPDIVELYKQGFSVPEIARKLEISKAVVIKLLRAAALRGEI